MTLAEWEAQYRKPVLSDKQASAATLPYGTGDGYGFGGGAIVVIGDATLVIGERDGGLELAQEIARRWNHTANVCDHKLTDGLLLPEGGAQATCRKCGLVVRSNL